jgi:hypothetical protein
MSKGLKKVVGVAAAIAIPFAAPFIAGSAFLAGVAGTIGTTATSALVGAGLGAAKGAVLGEDVGRQALYGGIGGGVGGFQAARAAQQATQAGQAAQAGQTLANASQIPGIAPVGTGTVLRPPAPAGLNMAGTAAPVGAGTVLQAGAQGVPQPAATFADALRQVPASVAAKFSDPAVLADLTLRAGGMLAGSLAAGSGLSPEEEKLLTAQTEELRRAQTENVNLFNQKLQQASQFLGESKYFDPEYFGLQSARKQQVAGAQAKQAGLRGVTGAQRTAEARRYDLGTARSTGTAYDTGFGAGVQGRLQAQQAGLNAMPSMFPTSDAGYTSLRSAYGDADVRRGQQAKDIGALFAPLGEEPKDKQANPFA